MKRVTIALILLVAACSESGEPPLTDFTTTSTQASTATIAPYTSVDIALPATFDPTPAQSEGPYYPVAKPADRDNNLLQVGDSSELPAGDPMEIFGLLLDTDGAPVAGATVEIWQVDGSGVYDHPDDPGTAGRDLRFQFYGESVTNPDGLWSFLTLDPAVYEPRARHIHVKVRIDGTEALTTQIYFAGDEDQLSRDVLAGRLTEESLGRLTATYAAGTLSNGLNGVISTHVIVLDT